MKELIPLSSSIKDRPVAVFGLARSGLSSIRALKEAEINVFAWDDNEQSRKAAADMGALIVPLTPDNLKDCAFLLLSPGVPLHYPAPHPVVLAAQRANIEIICDIELFHRAYSNIRTIAVTGTNGKSTTTALIHHILKSSGRPTVMGGNIGIPVFDLTIENKPFVVLELSSYQLDLCPTFRPEISVLMNITPDHIDRHGTLENYTASKERMFEGSGVAIISKDDDPSQQVLERTQAKAQRLVIPFSIHDDEINELKNNMILKGDHNLQNALAAYHACRAAGLSKEEILAGLRTFPGLPHRQYPVRTIGNVTYINDSKATNGEATSKALATYDNIYWIVGGRAKDGGLKGLEDLMPHVRESFLIGEAMPSFASWMKKNNVQYQENKTLDVALRAAHAAAQKNKNPSVVLLSPACASWDQFSSYEERGDVFARIVNSLEESAAA